MAKRFRFPLERLARVRAIEERLARVVWANAEAAAREAEAAAESAREELKDSRADLAKRTSKGPLEARTVMLQHAVMGGLGRHLKLKQEEFLSRRGQADRIGETWRTRRADSEALARLREKSRLAHVREEVRRETVELDEVALGRSRGREDHPTPGRDEAWSMETPDLPRSS